MAPVRAPEAVGVKTTEIAQLAPAATLLPQVFVWLKSPLAAMLAIESAAVPVLVSVTTCAALDVPTFWLPKLRLVGLKLIPGVAVPVPVSPTVCGLPVALSVTVMAPERVPAAVGLKTTEIAQLAPEATLLP